MKIEAQEILPLLEETGKLAFWDTEASGLRGDYNSALVFSVKPYGREVKSFVVEQPGKDSKIVRAVRDELEQYLAICGYYSKGFDLPFLRTRLLRWNANDIKTPAHIDLYYVLKGKLLTARKSQGHLLSFLETPEEKMSVSPNVWNDVVVDPGKNLKILQKRCESDVEGLEALYNATRHLIRDIKK